MPTDQECKKIIFNVGVRLGVSPKLISTRLLSKEDKQDMLNGDLLLENLLLAVKLWQESGMPDYANGSYSIYKPRF